MGVPKKPAARGLYWYVRFKGASVNGMSIEEVAAESGTPASSIYEHAEAAGLRIERQRARVRIYTDAQAYKSESLT